MNIDVWKQAKKEQKLTISQIAEKANLPIGSVQNIFAGYVPNPRIDTVIAIEQALGLRISLEERAAGASETIKKSITPLEDEMLYIFRKIGKKHGEEAQQALITVAEKML